MINKNIKKILMIIAGILFIFLIKLIFTFSTNRTVIFNYENNKYREDLIKVLKITNLNEPYIVYYNEGNILNQEKKYDEALISYEKALKKNPTDKRKCDIYINMSITMIQMIETEKKEEILEKLKEARENLYNNHCADEQDTSGKSQDAENLEDEIRKMEQEIENASGDDIGNKNSKDQNEEGETEEEKTIEKELEDINKEAQKNNQKDSEDNKSSGDYQIYQGKSW